MSEIDQRIVELRFENKEFEQRVLSSTKSLENLQRALTMEDIANTMHEIKDAVNGFSLESIYEGIESLTHRFSTFGIVGMTVINELTSTAMNFVKKTGNYIKEAFYEGGKNRALNIEQAKFQFQGLGMDIEATMANALYAVTDTAFGLDEAARVAGQLGASGMKAGDDMAKALRAVSGVAAMTSSSYTDMGNIFTSVAGNGRLMGNQLLQLSTRGLNAAAVIAKEIGKTEAEVRKMVSNGQVSFEMFYTAMDNAFGEQSTKANETYAGSLSNVRANIAKLGEDIWLTKLENHKNLFNAILPQLKELRKILLPFIGEYNKAMVSFYTGLSGKIASLDLSPLSNILNGLYNLVKSLGRILSTIGEAFREVFPPKTSTLFADFAINFENFTKKLVVGQKVLETIKTVFITFFTVIRTVTDSIKKLFGIITTPIEAIKKKEKDVKQFGETVEKSFKPLESIAEFFNAVFAVLSVGFRNLGEFLKRVFDNIGHGLTLAREQLKTVTSGFSIDLETGLKIFNTGIFAGILMMAKKFVKTIQGIDLGFSNLFKQLAATLGVFQEKVKAEILMKIAIAIGILAVALLILSTIDPVKLATSLGAVATMMAELFGAMAIMGKISVTKGIGEITKTIILMLGMFTALLILTIAVKKLAALDVDQLKRGIIGVGVLMGELLIMLKLLPDKGMTIGRALGLILLATALTILTKAVKELALLNVNQLIKGLGAIGILLLELAIFMKIIDKVKIGAGSALSLLAFAGVLVIFSKALSAIGKLKTDQIKQSLATIGILLLELAVFMKLISGLDKTGKAVLSLLVLATTLSIFTNVMGVLGSMKPDELKTGLIALAGGLGMMTLALIAMQKGVAGAGAMLIMATALAILTPILITLGQMEIGQVGVALLALGGALAIFAGTALLLAPISGPLLLLSAALLVLGAAVALVGGGILALSVGLGALAISGAAGIAVLMGAITGLIALLPFMVSKLAEAFTAFVTGIADNAVAIGEAFKKIFFSMLDNLVVIIPKIVETVFELLKAILKALVDHIPDLVKAGFDLLLGFLRGIRDNIKETVAVGIEIAVNFIKGVAEKIGDVVQAGVELVIAFINGLANAIEENTDKMIEAITNLVTAILSSMWKVLSGGIFRTKKETETVMEQGIEEGVKSKKNTVVERFKGVITDSISAIGRFVDDFISVGGDLINGLVKGIKDGLSKVTSAARQVATDAYNAAKNALESKSPSRLFARLGEFTTEGFVLGIERSVKHVRNAAADMGINAKDALFNTIRNLNSLLEDDMIFSPTIRPVVDLTEASKDLVDLFGKKRVVAGYADMRINDILKTSKKVDAPVSDSVITNNTTQNHFVIHATIREESDIRKLAKELDDLQRRNSRGCGVLA